MMICSDPGMYDAAVVGGGPAGASAALKLAAAGAKVALIEQKPLPRDKICGGGVVGRARSFLNLDIRSAVEREFYSAQINLLSSNLSITARRDSPLVFMTMRSIFDHLLVSAAEKSGADIIAGTRVTSFFPTKTHVKLETTSGTIAARVVIAADGASSILAKKAGWKETRVLARALASKIFLPETEMARYERNTRFDFDIPPNGYAWLFPKAIHLSVGVLSFKCHASKLKQALACYQKALGINKIEREELRGFVIPVSPRGDGFSRNRLMLVGDAAGFADPLTCEGISFAIKSGQLAAASLIQSSLEWGICSAHYERSIKKEIMPELSAARFLSKFLYGPPGLRTWLFKRWGDKFSDIVAGIIAGESTYHQEMRKPKNFLKLIHYGRHKRTPP